MSIKISKKAKTILALELFFVIGVFIFILSMKPTAIAPVSGHVISDGDFSFDFENARSIVVSSDAEFKSRMEFSKDFAVKLPPGTYYWKAKSWFRESEARNFTIASRIALRLDEINGTLVIYNTGNKDVRIRILDGEEVFGNGTLVEGHYVKEDLGGNNITGEIIVEGEQYG
ncbi:hypothetical protein J4447_01930 [Candidatus Pacearchaeota archaeon]|nr:hypothetical protein [Candidatus Pacearchaeota archaeon]